jgi:dTDP-4-amino-4,6-dideoxygalactose transaminase
MLEEPRRQITLGCLNIGPAEKRNVNDVLDNNRLSYGRYSKAFEQEFARLHQVRHAILMNSGTSALQVALAALKEQYKWQDGDEVLVPAVTFIATSNIIMMNRLTPVFVDVDPRTYNLDPTKMESNITSRTRAVIPVHLCGLPCDMDPILEIARRHGLRILEDSCETMFSRYRGKPVGSFGDAAAFSTYVAHLIVTGVGGLVTTDSDDLATKCRSLMAHGRDAIYLSIDDDDTNDEAKLRAIVERRFSFQRLGFSYRVTEMEAALGLGQLEGKDRMLAKRGENATYLTKGLRRFEEFLQLPHVPDGSEHAFMMYAIVVRGGCDREKLVNHLERNGVETRYLLPLLTQPVYRRLFGNIIDQYPVAKMVHENGFYIGCHQDLTAADMDYVVEVIDGFFRA